MRDWRGPRKPGKRPWATKKAKEERKRKRARGAKNLGDDGLHLGDGEVGSEEESDEDARRNKDLKKREVESPSQDRATYSQNLSFSTAPPSPSPPPQLSSTRASSNDSTTSTSTPSVFLSPNDISNLFASFSPSLAFLGPLFQPQGLRSPASVLAFLSLPEKTLVEALKELEVPKLQSKMLLGKIFLARREWE